MKSLFPQFSQAPEGNYRPLFFWLLFAGTSATALAAACLGPMQIPAAHLPLIVLKPLLPSGFLANVPDVQVAVVWDLRIPRLLLALLVGAALATAGAVLQGLFRNPLADPGLVGVSAGAAFGSVFAVVFGSMFTLTWLSPWLLPAAAMLGGLGAVWTVYFVSRVDGRTHLATMLLAGIALNALSGAGVGIMIYTATDEQLRRFTFWTLGSFAGASWPVVAVTAVCVVLPIAWLFRFRRFLNAFLLGETEAYHLGVPVQHLKRIMILLCAVMVGTSVAGAGMVGFIGLVVPHILRLLIGPDHRILLPASALAGAWLMLLADILARTLNAPSEIPVGILTALMGAPFFLYLLLRQRNAFSF